MQTDFVTVIGIAALAAVASPVGGLLALWRSPTTLFMSIALGFAAGVLLGTIGFEMLPQALELSSVWIAAAGFGFGLAAVYGLDLFVNRGKVAGAEAEQHDAVEADHRRRGTRGSPTTVLAGGTSAEELIEGLSIGIGAAVKPGLGLLIALAIVIDNVAEALSIGQLIRSEGGEPKAQRRRVLGWTSLIGAALLGSALAGWFLLQGLAKPILGCLFGVGGGAMFYLTVSQLVPEADARHYQQSAALAMAAGFAVIFVLSSFL